MRIIVEGSNKENTKTIAVFLHSLLSSWAIPVNLDAQGTYEDFDRMKRRIRRVADKLQKPITVTTKTTNLIEVEKFNWISRLTTEDDRVIVKGTWVTVGHVISLIVDGWTWSDILKTHPELTEDDIRACLSYSIQEDSLQVEYNQENHGSVTGNDAPNADKTVEEDNFPMEYVRISGRPQPVGWKKSY